MQFKTIATIFAIAGVALAQDLAGVPKCAVAPALAAFGKTGCTNTNIKCICQSTTLVGDLESAIAAACSPDDLASEYTCNIGTVLRTNRMETEANAFAVDTCGKAGVTLNIPGYTASAGASSTSATVSSTSSVGSPSTTSMATTSTATSASSTAPASTMTSASGAVVSTSSASVSSASTTKATSSSASTSPSPGAANSLQVGGSALFGAILAALAL